MEDTLRGLSYLAYLIDYQVLILVLMEDTLRVRRKKAIRRKDVRLNPCFNGRYSQSQRAKPKNP